MANVKKSLKLLNSMVKTADDVVSSSATTKGAVKFLNGAVKQADEVVESTVKKSSNQLIKAGGNYLESNKTTAQRTAKNMSTTVRKGADTANDVINARTTMNSSVPEVSGTPVQSRINRNVSDVPSAQDTSTKIIGEGTSRGGGFDTSNAIDLDPIEVGPNQRVERRSNRRGNNTQQPETPKVIYSGQGDNPKVIYADGPTTGGGGSGNNGGGGNSTSSSSSAGDSGGNQGQRQTRSKSTRQPIDIKSKAREKAGQYVNDYFGGITDTYNNVIDGGGFLDSFKKAHQKDDGSINMKRAAGTFIAASAAARVASGGGLYKDRYGNPNLIGVPFI